VTALADQSTMPAWPAWAWLVLAAVLVLGSGLLNRPHKARQGLAQAVTTRPRCWHHGCRYTGAVAVLTAHDNLRVYVCQGHATEGTVRGYWRRAA
jgi:hypothetical protein